mgnify:CR=1 FL=1
MSGHILLKHAKRKPYSKIPEMPEGAVFDDKRGYWVSGADPLVSPGSKYPRNVIRKLVRIRKGNDR